MKIRFSLIFLISNFSFHVWAAGEHTVIGGRAAGLGNASIALFDGWSVFNNQAGLAWCRKFSAGAYFENRFLVKELSIKAIGAVLPVKKGAFALSFSHFGYSLYNEIKTGLAFGMNFGNSFSAGIQIDYMRFYIGNEYGTANLFTFEIGLQYRIKEQLCLGVHIYNPIPIKLTDDQVEWLPTVIRFGTGWQISGNLLVSAEIEKDLINKPILKAGMEYHLANPLYIRIGYLTEPSQFTFGIGLVFGKLSFDIASSYNMVLGFSPQGSLIYNFK
jgi:hypothetical protein